MERQQIEDLVANPHRHFGQPWDVLNAGDLSYDVKLRILESWKLDAARLAESTAENMSGGEESDLREVSKTLTALKSMEDAPKVATRKPRRFRRPPGVKLGMTVGGVVGAAMGLLLIAGGGWAFAATGWLGSALLLAETVVIGAVMGGLASAVGRTVRA